MITNQKFDGHRGLRGIGGWWISLAEARKRSAGRQDWWQSAGVDGRKVAVKQHDPEGPLKKPIWLFLNGDMYFGEWRLNFKGQTIESGFGITYIKSSHKYLGRIYVGEWKSGMIHGLGSSFWLESSPIWKNNSFPGSEIFQRRASDPAGKEIGVPYIYTGRYNKNLKEDPLAVVALKDGTTRVGPWWGGKLVGSWFIDHRVQAEQQQDVRIASKGGDPAAASEDTNTANPAIGSTYSNDLAKPSTACRGPGSKGSNVAADARTPNNAAATEESSIVSATRREGYTTAKAVLRPNDKVASKEPAGSEMMASKGSKISRKTAPATVRHTDPTGTGPTVTTMCKVLATVAADGGSNVATPSDVSNFASVSRKPNDNELPTLAAASTKPRRGPGRTRKLAVKPAAIGTEPCPGPRRPRKRQRNAPTARTVTAAQLKHAPSTRSRTAFTTRLSSNSKVEQSPGHVSFSFESERRGTDTHVDNSMHDSRASSHTDQQYNLLGTDDANSSANTSQPKEKQPQQRALPRKDASLQRLHQVPQHVAQQPSQQQIESLLPHLAPLRQPQQLPPLQESTTLMLPQPAPPQQLPPQESTTPLMRQLAQPKERPLLQDPLVIEIDDSDDASDPEEPLDAYATVANRTGCVSRIQEVAEWLTSVFGSSPLREHMVEYAGQFLELGYHSVEFIKHECTEEDIRWMRPIHRKVFMRDAGLRHSR